MSQSHYTQTHTPSHTQTHTHTHTLCHTQISLGERYSREMLSVKGIHWQNCDQKLKKNVNTTSTH